jgi:hypothetical protein
MAVQDTRHLAPNSPEIVRHFRSIVLWPLQLVPNPDAHGEHWEVLEKLTPNNWRPAQVTKALLYFTIPSIGERGVARISHERANEFVIPGLVFIGLGFLMLYLVVR